jgi:hypothetical protein
VAEDCKNTPLLPVPHCCSCRAQTLGLNTLRFRAFADGAPGVGSAVQVTAAGQEEQEGDADSFDYVALQPAPGVLNGTMLR